MNSLRRLLDRLLGRTPEALRASIAHYEGVLASLPQMVVVEITRPAKTQYEAELEPYGVVEGREVVSNPEYVKVERIQIGGGAALAGRHPDALLVDGRGRWQADASENIAQTAQHRGKAIRVV